MPSAQLVHQAFGQGTVLSIDTQGPQAVLEVQFPPETGVKRLLCSPVLAKVVRLPNNSPRTQVAARREVNSIQVGSNIVLEDPRYARLGIGKVLELEPLDKRGAVVRIHFPSINEIKLYARTGLPIRLVTKESEARAVNRDAKKMRDVAQKGEWADFMPSSEQKAIRSRVTKVQ